MSASWPTAEDVRLSGASRRHGEEGGSPTRWQLVPVIRPCSDAGNHQSSLGRIPNKEEKRTHTYKHKGAETLIHTEFVTSWFLNGVSRWIGWKGHLSFSDASATSGLTHTLAHTHAHTKSVIPFYFGCGSHRISLLISHTNGCLTAIVQARLFPFVLYSTNFLLLWSYFKVTL